MVGESLGSDRETVLQKAGDAPPPDKIIKIRQRNLDAFLIGFIIVTSFANDMFDAQGPGSIFIDLTTGDIDQPTPPLIGFGHHAGLLKLGDTMEKLPAPFDFFIFFHDTDLSHKGQAVQIPLGDIILKLPGPDDLSF